MVKEPDIIDQALFLLDQISSDRTVPRNIRESIINAKKKLNEETETKIKIDAAVQILDEVISDPNLPVYTRTQIWSAVGILESYNA